MDLGARLKSARKAKKLTQEDVARILGIDDTTISKHENGKSEPDLDTIHRYAKLYGVPPETLVTEYKTNINKSEFVLRELIEKYNIDLSVPETKEKLEKIIQIVLDDVSRKKQ